jgi:hypothetical protein
MQHQTVTNKIHSVCSTILVSSGTSMTKEEMVRFTVRIPKSLWDTINEDAVKHERSMVRHVKVVLEEYYGTEAGGEAVIGPDQAEIMAGLLELSKKPGFDALLRALQSQGEPNRLPSFAESYEDHKKQGKK